MLNQEQIASRKAALDIQAKSLISRITDAKASGRPITADMQADHDQWIAEKSFLDAEATKINTQNFGMKMHGGGEQAAPEATRSQMIPEAALKELWHAGKSRQSLRLDTKDFQVQTKAPFGTGNFTAGTLPAILRPDLSLGLPFEPDRAFDHFQAMAAPDGPAVEYVQHDANANPAAAVAQLGTKPDLGVSFTTVTKSFTKIAALCSISMEALQDFHTFATWLPMELGRAIMDSENGQVISGSGAGANMFGILNTAGILTRAMAADTPLDAIRKAVNDIRVGTSFAEANLIILNPSTFADFELLKNTQGSYLLNPDDPMALGNTKSIFGVPLVKTTAIPAGTALVLDARTILAWTRMAIQLETNIYGGDSSTASYWQSNVIGYRAEERIAIGVTRPTAVVKVTGLPV